jgi:endonuclease YncB( thermonuclease family)
VRWDWPASTVTRVIDGDTFVARLSRDLGFNGVAVFEQRLRVAGVNAPKLATPAGKASHAAAIELLRGPVSIATTGAYKYGDEWMAEVTLSDGRDFAETLIATGHAVRWDGTGARPADS